jgi:reticulon-4-interacting protein 1, mitochondrial
MKRTLLTIQSPSDRPEFVMHSDELPAPRAGEIQVQVESTCVNPIDVKRAYGYGSRLLGVKKAAAFPLAVGNDFVGRIVAVGAKVRDHSIGDLVLGLQPMGPIGTHVSALNVSAYLVRPLQACMNWRESCVLPYTYTTMRLALEAVGLKASDAKGRRVLIHGASGGLGLLALQTLAQWGVHITAICGGSNEQLCLKMGADEVFDRHTEASRQVPPRFDATLNFAAWSDDSWLISRLKPGALGHATTVHPLLEHFDHHGWIGGLFHTLRDKRRHQQLAKQQAGPGCRYSWVVFSPKPSYLSDMVDAIQKQDLHLPIGIKVPFSEAGAAFEHTRHGRPGRAVLLANSVHPNL